VSTRPLPSILPELARTATPSTVIPVPALPTVDATRRSRLEPVVRTAASQVLVSRFAKGTGPVDPPTLSSTRPAAVSRTRPAAMIVEDTHPNLSANLSVGDHTTPGVAPATRRTTAAPASELDDSLGEPVAPPAPSSGDRTKPGIALPAAARTVALPSIKQRAAR